MKIHALALVGLASLFPVLGRADSVAITTAGPIEQLDADGHVSGVSMAKVGDVYSVVRADGANLILTDGGGGQYLIAAQATNYVPPPPAPVATQTASATNTAPVSPTLPAVAPPTAAAAPPPGTNVASAAPAPGGLSADDAAKMKQINDALGVRLLANGDPWQEDIGQMAYRLQWPQESLTRTEESYRRYARQGEAIILGTSAYSLALYGKTGKPTYISIVFANAGDFSFPAKSGEMPDQSEMLEDLARAVKKDVQTITDALTPLLGDPSSDFYGSTSDDRDEVRRWDWKNVSILLSAHGGEYASLKIVPTEVADKHGTVDVVDRDRMRDLLAQRVVKRPNGDVVISEIPMVDQGPKGYCVDATWERYLRYMDVPADLYVLAAMGGTGLGGGTSDTGMAASMGNYVSAYHRRIEPYNEQLDLPSIAKYIDQGLPLMWACFVTDGIELQTSRNTAARQGLAMGPELDKYRAVLDAQDKALEKSTETIARMDNGHMRLIIGYNYGTQEIAISDSWGPVCAERWMSIATVNRISANWAGYLSW